MKYFLHDSNSFNDEKITELFIKFGYEGLGLFYTILEKLAQQEKPIKTDVLKHQLKVGKRLNKCWLFMEEIEIISSNNRETFNKQLLNFSEKYQIKKEKNAKRISQWRSNQKDKENVTHYESVSNTPKIKESKVNISKVKVIDNNNNLSDFLELMNNQIWIETIAMNLRVSPVKITELRNEFVSDRKLDENYKDLENIKTWFVNFVKRNKDIAPKQETRAEKTKRLIELANKMQ